MNSEPSNGKNQGGEDKEAEEKAYTCIKVGGIVVFELTRLPLKFKSLYKSMLSHFMVVLF